MPHSDSRVSAARHTDSPGTSHRSDTQNDQDNRSGGTRRTSLLSHATSGPMCPLPKHQRHAVMVQIVESPKHNKTKGGVLFSER
jgi:hypothetical protein